MNSWEKCLFMATKDVRKQSPTICGAKRSELIKWVNWNSHNVNHKETIYLELIFKYKSTAKPKTLETVWLPTLFPV